GAGRNVRPGGATSDRWGGPGETFTAPGRRPTSGNRFVLQADYRSSVCDWVAGDLRSERVMPKAPARLMAARAAYQAPFVPPVRGRVPAGPVWPEAGDCDTVWPSTAVVKSASAPMDPTLIVVGCVSSEVRLKAWARALVASPVSAGTAAPRLPSTPDSGLAVTVWSRPPRLAGGLMLTRSWSRRSAPGARCRSGSRGRACS